jgi:penicillin-binding protein 2
LTKYLNTADTEWYKQRVIISMLFVAAAFMVLFVRLFYLQVIKGDELRRLSENNCIRLQSTDPPRGLIYDRNGVLLVDNRPSFDLTIILKDANPVENTLQKLSRYIHIPESKLTLRIAADKHGSSYKPIVLKQDIGRDMVAAVEAHKYDLPGIGISVKPKRHYLNKKFAAHLIGYLGEINSNELKLSKYSVCKQGDYIGKFGAEKTFESFLRGQRGGRQVEVNVMGQVVGVLKTVEAQPGNNLFLTIDHKSQQQAEALLKSVAGAVVALDPATGHVLVLASSPPFDQNVFVNGMSQKQWQALISNPFRPMENKAVQGEYPPASTFKIITAAAGLEEGIIDENFTVYCPGYYKFGDRVYRCWKKGGHGEVNLVKALTESCDVYFYQVGQQLKVDRIAFYATAFGLGSPTGINLDHEAAGLIPTAAWKKRHTGISWQGGETLSVAIGQGYNLVTPMQMAVLTAAVANGGTRYKPLILTEIKTPKGKTIIAGEPQVIGKLPISKQTLATINKCLWEVVNNPKGTGRIARIDGIEVSGKTGTAQLVQRREDDTESNTEISHHHKAHAWFVAYAPSTDPKIAVAVIVEHGEHGSSAAAPIARDIIKTYLKKDESGV